MPVYEEIVCRQFLWGGTFLLMSSCSRCTDRERQYRETEQTTNDCAVNKKMLGNKLWEEQEKLPHDSKKQAIAQIREKQNILKKGIVRQVLSSTSENCRNALTENWQSRKMRQQAAA